ncbi:hypothetical protein ACF0H5_023400 [Mactra antiquata]
MADNVTSVDIQNAQIIWDYMKLNHICEKSDVILCLGSYDVRVAEKAATLFLQGYGDWLVFSGNSGVLTKGIWSRPEAVVFAERALEMGVAAESILIEDKSTNTGENVKFSHALLKERGIQMKSVIIVQKPYMERRAYATFMKQWPEDCDRLRVAVSSLDVSLENYPSDTTGTLRDVISVVIGDFARIRLYEKKGFQIPQEIPDTVQESFEQLQSTGQFNSHMP